MQNKSQIRADYYNSPDDAWFDTKSVSIIIGRSVPWLHAKAHAGGGIPFFKMGQTRKYKKSDIESWLMQHAPRYCSTSEYPSSVSRGER
jgi:hypothetical protein